MNKGIKKITQRLRKIQSYQADIISSACFCVLWDMGYREDWIMTHFDGATKVLVECKDRKMSAFEVLEEETDIEMSLDGEKSYHEFAFLSDDTQVDPLDDMQWIYMLQRKIRWTPLIIMSGLCVELYRTEKWEYEQLAEFISKVDEIRRELGEEKKNYDRFMFDKTGFKPEEMWGC